MEIQIQKIIVTREFANAAQKWLDSEEPRETEGVDRLTANFGNGIEADIKICYGQDNTYVDSVLFHDGCEVCVAEVGYEVLGPTCFEYEGVEYIVDVISETERRLQKIFVSREEAIDIQKYLDADNGTLVHEFAPKVDILQADFGDGVTAEIRICYELDTNFIDPILYLDDEEIQTLDCEYELLGKVEFDYEGIEYVVSVEIEPQEM